MYCSATGVIEYPCIQARDSRPIQEITEQDGQRNIFCSNACQMRHGLDRCMRR